MQQPPVLNDGLIAELRDIMGSDFDTLVESYRQDGSQRLAALHEAVREGYMDGIRQQAHSFKGSSGNLGALRVSALCLEMEQLARDQQLETAGDRLAALEQAFEESCQALDGQAVGAQTATP
ncbi:Hpt domain-containing protein [Alloalcanivorax gelatiniphagus]|uniref:Hpt domain-containing protein n=1 Tax=Alloalcanivorax gelatiniphagus TaxID=1194167 RepID=A0ABY2XPW4_9GAMM|nr:Hpt domain-containing protein [Alloalcanivorax gelatiniphagus]TMW13733.1 Hpt domain-containing protein [Alloalcanivorax gelatiniphagus]